MALPWSTFARSPTIGVEAPKHGRGHGEARASVETLWGVCGERGANGGEVWWQGGARVAFYRRAAGSPWAGSTGAPGDERPRPWGVWVVRQHRRTPLGLREALQRQRG